MMKKEKHMLLIAHEKFFRNANNIPVPTRRIVRFAPQAGAIVTDSRGSEYMVQSDGSIVRTGSVVVGRR